MVGPPSEEEQVWVFGYGSLIWYHPSLTVLEERVGWLEGWHRDWMCISVISRHGAPTCNLEEGGRVKGVFFRLSPETVTKDLESLRGREGRNSERIVKVPGVSGEVHYWSMTRNLERHHKTRGLHGRDLYRYLARVAMGITEKGPDNKDAVEYALEVSEFDPADPITTMYVEEIRALKSQLQ